MESSSQEAKGYNVKFHPEIDFIFTHTVLQISSNKTINKYIFVQVFSFSNFISK